MALAPPSSAKPQCSCPPSNSDAPTQTPDHLTVNIKIAHTQDTRSTNPIRNPNQHPTLDNDTGTTTTHAQQVPEPTSTIPSTLRTILPHHSTEITTLDLLTSQLNHLDTAQASSRKAQLKQIRLSKKQHERLMAKVDGVEGILTCIHDEFHGQGGPAEGQQQQGNPKRMCERIDQMEKLVVWAWSEMMEMRKGIDGKMGRVEEKIERVVGLLAEMRGKEGKEG
jgi:hypothetical protein